MMAQ